MNLIIDSIMGSGKTTWAIRCMNHSPQRRYIFVTPFLTEDKRIREGCPSLNFVEPDGTYSKLSDLKRLVAEGRNVATTHALLGQWKPTDKDTDNLRRWNYTLILDEALEMIQPVQRLNSDDMDILRDEWIEIEAATGKVRWIAETCPQRYRDIEKLAKAGRLHICRNSQLLDLTPIDILKAMPNLIVLTFLFEASHMCYYMHIHGMKWKKAHIHDGRLQMGEADLTQKKQEIKALLSIYDGKYNRCGEEKKALSSSFWSSTQNIRERYQVVKNIRSFFLTRCRSHVNQCMWSIFKDKKLLCASGQSTDFQRNNRISLCRVLKQHVQILFHLGVAVLVFKYDFVCASGFQFSDLAVDVLLIFVGRATCVSVLHKHPPCK